MVDSLSFVSSRPRRSGGGESRNIFINALRRSECDKAVEGTEKICELLIMAYMGTAIIWRLFLSFFI